MSAAATYEEPWDRGKQQKQLQAKIQKGSPKNQDHVSHRSSVKSSDRMSQKLSAKETLDHQVCSGTK